MVFTKGTIVRHKRHGWYGIVAKDFDDNGNGVREHRVHVAHGPFWIGLHILKTVDKGCTVCYTKPELLEAAVCGDGVIDGLKVGDTLKDVVNLHNGHYHLLTLRSIDVTREEVIMQNLTTGGTFGHSFADFRQFYHDCEKVRP